MAGEMPLLHGATETSCSWTSYSWLFGTEPCTNEATRVVTHGCEHEHVVRSLTCDDCIDMVKRTFASGKAFCTPCRDKGGQDGVVQQLLADEPLTSVGA